MDNREKILNCALELSMPEDMTLLACRRSQRWPA